MDTAFPARADHEWPRRMGPCGGAHPCEPGRAARRALARFGLPLRRFLGAHPGHALSAGDYALYQRLRAPYDATFRRVNRTIGVANATVSQLNHVVLLINARGRAVNALLAAEAR